MFFMVLETCCDQLLRVAASRLFFLFSIPYPPSTIHSLFTLQSYKKYLKLPNISSIIFANNSCHFIQCQALVTVNGEALVVVFPRGEKQ